MLVGSLQPRAAVRAILAITQLEFHPEMRSKIQMNCLSKQIADRVNENLHSFVTVSFNFFSRENLIIYAVVMVL